MEVSKKDLEDIIDEKVEKRLRERKRGTARGQIDTPDEESDSNLSRRSFLKAAGAGAVGLGAAAMIGNASAFRINSDQGLSYFNRSSNQSQFNVSADGVLGVNQIGTAKNPVSSVHSKTVNAEELFTTEADIDTGRLQNNTSARGEFGRVYQGAAVADDGTHYALHHDGSDLVLYKSTDVASLSEQYRWTSVSDSKKKFVHITAAGTVLLTGAGRHIHRSTDGGESFNQVGNFGSLPWGVTENATTGDLVVSPNGSTGTVALYRSTDDGQTWSQIADGNTFSEFSRHVHSVRYHPVNNWLIVTGGDSGTTGWYRSTDDGSTWDYYNEGNIQWVGICPHPTDGNTYLLGGDDSDYGPIARVNDDGTSVSIEPVLNPITEAQPPLNSGTFRISCFHDPTGRSGYALVGAGDSNPVVWVSDTLNGDRWRSLGPVKLDGYDYVYDQTTSQGGGETIIDPTTVDSIIMGGTALRPRQSLDYHYGADVEKPLDERYARGNVHFLPDQGLLWHQNLKDSDAVNLLKFRPSGGDAFQLQAKNGYLNFRNGSTGDIPMYIAWDLGFIGFNGTPLKGIKEYSNAAATDLKTGEFAIDENRGGTGNTAWLYREPDTNTTHYWDSDGTL